MNNFVKTVFFFFLLVTAVTAQIKDYELGSKSLRFNQQTGFYDLSDPETVNIKVSVWGWVRYPGKYLVPINTTVSDLLSYAGGPNEGADLEDLRLYRINEDGTQELIKLTMNNIMYESKLAPGFKSMPKVLAGDVLAVPGEPKLYFRDHMSIWMSIISLLISLTILVLNITKN